MRASSIFISVGIAVATTAACGDDADNDPPPHDGAGAGGATGGVAVGGFGGSDKSRGGASGGGGSGTNAVSGSGGINGSAGAATPGASGSGGDASAGGDDVGPATGGVAGGGGDVSPAGGVSGGDGSAGTASNCSAIADPNRLIFVSSALYTGNLGGLTGADSKCQGLADAAGLCGTFKAWLSDGTGNAVDRLTHATGDYVLTDGHVVATGWTALTTATLQHAIDVTEAEGDAPVGTVKCGGSPQTPVWTGAASNGIGPANGSCSNWGSTSSGPGAAFGNANATNAAWSGLCQITTVCPDTAALYCLQQ